MEYNKNKKSINSEVNDKTLLKICKGCNIPKLPKEFGEDRRTKLGIKAKCLSCEEEYIKKRKEDKKAYKREYNKTHVHHYIKEEYEKGKSKQREYYKKYYQDHKNITDEQNNSNTPKEKLCK